MFVFTTDAITVKVALDEPAPMSTDAGTMAAETSLERLMVVMLEAALVRVTVHIDDVGGVTLAGLQLRLESPPDPTG
jgi:hypothetical protein